MQALLKRQRSSEVYDSESEARASFENSESSDDGVDISNVLIGNKKRRLRPPMNKSVADRLGEDSEQDDTLADFIRSSVSKRNVKLGTEVVKQAKGKSKKIAKGEVGGGSFQSMGM
jgi:ATP-dependent RNA helicase DDX54/DBP10